jgi:hypothetical protein
MGQMGLIGRLHGLAPLRGAGLAGRIPVVAPTAWAYHRLICWQASGLRNICAK